MRQSSWAAKTIPGPMDKLKTILHSCVTFCFFTFFNVILRKRGECCVPVTLNGCKYMPLALASFKPFVDRLWPVNSAEKKASTEQTATTEALNQDFTGLGKLFCSLVLCFMCLFWFCLGAAKNRPFFFKPTARLPTKSTGALSKVCFLLGRRLRPPAAGKTEIQDVRFFRTVDSFSKWTRAQFFSGTMFLFPTFFVVAAPLKIVLGDPFFQAH